MFEPSNKQSAKKKKKDRAVKGIGIGVWGGETGAGGIGVIKEDLSAEVPFMLNSED